MIGNRKCKQKQVENTNFYQDQFQEKQDSQSSYQQNEGHNNYKNFQSQMKPAQYMSTFLCQPEQPSCPHLSQLNTNQYYQRNIKIQSGKKSEFYLMQNTKSMYQTPKGNVHNFESLIMQNSISPFAIGNEPIIQIKKLPANKHFQSSINLDNKQNIRISDQKKQFAQSPQSIKLEQQSNTKSNKDFQQSLSPSPFKMNEEVYESAQKPIHLINRAHYEINLLNNAHKLNYIDSAQKLTNDNNKIYKDRITKLQQRLQQKNKLLLQKQTQLINYIKSHSNQYYQSSQTYQHIQKSQLTLKKITQKYTQTDTNSLIESFYHQQNIKILQLQAELACYKKKYSTIQALLTTRTSNFTQEIKKYQKKIKQFLQINYLLKEDKFQKEQQILALRQKLQQIESQIIQIKQSKQEQQSKQGQESQQEYEQDNIGSFCYQNLSQYKQYNNKTYNQQSLNCARYSFGQSENQQVLTQKNSKKHNQNNNNNISTNKKQSKLISFKQQSSIIILAQKQCQTLYQQQKNPTMNKKQSHSQQILSFRCKSMVQQGCQTFNTYLIAGKANFITENTNLSSENTIFRQEKTIFKSENTNLTQKNLNLGLGNQELKKQIISQIKINNSQIDQTQNKGRQRSRQIIQSIDQRYEKLIQLRQKQHQEKSKINIKYQNENIPKYQNERPLQKSQPLYLKIIKSQNCSKNLVKYQANIQSRNLQDKQNKQRNLKYQNNKIYQSRIRESLQFADRIDNINNSPVKPLYNQNPYTQYLSYNVAEKSVEKRSHNNLKVKENHQVKENYKFKENYRIRETSQKNHHNQNFKSKKLKYTYDTGNNQIQEYLQESLRDQMKQTLQIPINQNGYKARQTLGICENLELKMKRVDISLPKYEKLVAVDKQQEQTTKGDFYYHSNNFIQNFYRQPVQTQVSTNDPRSLSLPQSRFSKESPNLQHQVKESSKDIFIKKPSEHEYKYRMKSESSEHFDTFSMNKTLQRSSSGYNKNLQPSYSTPIIQKHPIKDFSTLKNDQYQKKSIKNSSVNNATVSLKQLIAQKCKKLTLS